MRAGTLNSRVTIKHLVSGQGPDGQPTDVWVDVAKVWANIRTMNGVESIKADREVSVVQYSIRIRRRTDVTAAMRVHEEDGTIYEVKSVRPDKVTRDKIDLVCEAING